MVASTKHIFVTGGVASSLGKGLTASSLGNLLRARGVSVTMQKLDPYLNVDPGTMNPFQHGDTVQVIPHITNEIKERMRAAAAGSPGVRAEDAPDVIITEIGGTVGDIESLPFLEAARQVRHDLGRDDCVFIPVSLVPYLAPSGELTTKPTQPTTRYSKFAPCSCTRS